MANDLDKKTKGKQGFWLAKAMIFCFLMVMFACQRPMVYEGVSPPIILITLDTTRRDALSPYNSAVTTTPNLQAFSHEATVFENAYATAPWTLPTHVSMFTGYFPSRHGAGVSTTSFSSELHSLPVMLKKKGYATAGLSGGPFTSSRYGFDRGFQYFEDPEKPFTRAGSLIVNTQKFIRSHGENPFFAFVNIFDPHGPYHPPRAFRKAFDLHKKREAARAIPRWKDSFGSYGLFIRELAKMGVPEPEAKEFLDAAYAAEIAYVDYQLGLFFKWLKKRDLYERSLIIILADHGEFLGENGRYLHSYSLDHVLTHIPFMVKWPNQKQGKRNPGLVSQVDVFATVLKAAGIKIPANDGLPLDEVQPANDRWVLMEEHSLKPIHPLVDKDLFIADSVYGIQTLTARGIVWQGTNQCERLSQKIWQASDCGHSWEKDMAFIQNHIKLEPKVKKEDQQLSLSEREVLQSLGYIE